MKESADLSLKLNAIIMCFSYCMCLRRDRESAKWLMINTKHPLHSHRREFVHSI